MATWKTDVTAALFKLAKPAPLSEIYKVVRAIREERGEGLWLAHAEAAVRKALETSSSSSSWHNPTHEDLFENNQIGSGVWGLRDKERNRLLFKQWLELQGNSADHYSGGINAISRGLSEYGETINLYDVTDTKHLHELKGQYFSQEQAREQNLRGNNMYGRAFELYIEFMGQFNPVDTIAVFDGEDVQEIEPKERGVIEGELVERKVLSYQRNRLNIIRCKERDNYACLVCDFTYGKQIVEAHHLVPLHASKKVLVRLEDLVTLCPTCHRLAHVLLKVDLRFQQRDLLIERLKLERVMPA